jgi:hypothetical protein
MSETHATQMARAESRTPTDPPKHALHALAVVAGYAVFFVAFFSPVLFSHRLLAPGDDTHYFVPQFYSARVWWDSAVWGGTPALADPSALTWYPLWLACRLLPRALGWNAFMLAAYVLAASTTYGYVFSMTRSRLAAALSGASFGLCGFMIAHAVHASMIHTAAWTAPFVWSLEMLRRGGRGMRFWFAAGALSVACSALAGHPQIFVYTLSLGAACALFNSRRADIGRTRYLALAASLVLLGVGIAALQLVPSAELARLTPRASLDFEKFVAYELPPSQLVTFLFPLLYGGAPKTFYAAPYFGLWGSEGGGWIASEVTGYLGLLPLLLAAVACLTRGRRALKLFWLAVAAVALLLAMGSETPLAFVAYHLPVVNKFRAPGRHLLELSFAVSVLAGVGVRAVQRGAARVRLLNRVALGAVAVTLVCLAGLALYADQLDAQTRAAVSRGLSLAPWRNPALAVPLVILITSCAALVWWARRPASRARAIMLVAALVCDLASFGWFAEWRYESPDASIARPPDIALRLRGGLAATGGGRVLPVRGAGGTHEEMPPNLSKLWGVASAASYGPLIIERTRRLLSMLPHGEVTGAWAEPSDRSLDVFAVRYVAVPRETPGASAADAPGAEADLHLVFGKACGATRESLRFTPPAPVRATDLRVVSLLSCSTEVADNTPVLSVTLTDAAGRRTDLPLLAGRDSSEWAYDCPDVRAGVRHSRAPVSGSFPTARAGASCEGHDYASELKTGAAVEIKTIEMRWTGGDAAALVLKRLTLEDRERGASYHISPAPLLLNDETRWRLFAEEGGALIYENLRARPRAWLASDVVTLTAEEILAAIKTSRLPDGRTFDPARTALVEEPQTFSTSSGGALAQSGDSGGGEARVVEETGASISVETDAAASSFLVLADANYPGWRATVDGQEAHVFQTDYALRGVGVPAGRHAVRFEFRPRSFRAGLAVTLLSLAALAAVVSPFNPLFQAKPRRAGRTRGLASRLARSTAALLEGVYAQKSRREKWLLSSVVFLYPLAYLCNQIVRVDGRYTGVDNDFGYCYYDYKVYLLDNLNHLRFLLWSPAEGAGYPFYSCPFPGAFYPPNLLLVIFYRLAGGYAQYDHQLFTILGISVFALGLFHWLRLFPFNLRAVLFAALVMSASFKVTETLRFANSVQVAAWYPWILFAVTQIFRGQTTRRRVKYGLLLFAFLVCHFTGGYPYFVYYSVFLVPVYLLVFLVPALRRRLWRQPVGDVRASLAVIAASVGAATLLCAPYLYQTSRLLKETYDRGGGFGYATEHEFRPLHTLGSLLFPPSSQPEGWYYFGLAGFLLLLLYFFDERAVAKTSREASDAHSPEDDARNAATDATAAAWYRDHWIKIFFVAWIALISYVTYGRRSYLFALLFKVMPLFASLRVWGRLNIILVPVFAWLLALAYTSFEDRLSGGETDRTKRRALVNRQLLTLCACYAAALAAQLYLLRHRLYDFYWARLGDFAHVRGNEAQFILAGFLSFLALAALLALARRRALRSTRARALALAALVLVTALDTRPVGSQTWTYPATMTERKQLDVARQIRASFDLPRTEEPKQLPTTSAFSVGVLPRWYFARYNDFLARTDAERDARRKLLGVADGQKLFLSRSISHETVRAFLEDSARFGASARVASYDGDALALDVDAPAAGFVSFIDNWDAGWRASVDGQPAPIELLFGTFKSVRVQAGAHRVAFEYRPKFFGWLAPRD